MNKSNVHIILGDNASGKTRTLVEKVKEFSRTGTVLHNLDTDFFVGPIDQRKLDLLDECCNSGYEFDDGSFTDKTGIERYLLGKILSEGDYLILDEIDSYLPNQTLIDICAAICDVAPLWKEVWLAGHRPNLFRACTEDRYYLVQDGNLVVREGIDAVNEYLDTV